MNHGNLVMLQIYCNFAKDMYFEICSSTSALWEQVVQALKPENTIG